MMDCYLQGEPSDVEVKLSLASDLQPQPIASCIVDIL